MQKFRPWGFALGAWLLVLTLCALLLPAPELIWLFSESGPVELLSVWLWLVAALLALWRGWRPGISALSFATVMLGLADRESDFLKTHFGLHMARSFRQLRHLQDWPAASEAIAGLIMLTLLLAFLVASARVLHFLLAQGGLRHPAGQALLWAGGVLLCSQLAEALHNALPAESSPHAWLQALSLAIEEGLELAGAAFTLLALYQHPPRGGYLLPR